jgi:hypothetical protein
LNLFYTTELPMLPHLALYLDADGGFCNGIPPPFIGLNALLNPSYGVTLPPYNSVWPLIIF